MAGGELDTHRCRDRQKAAAMRLTHRGTPNYNPQVCLRAAGEAVAPRSESSWMRAFSERRAPSDQGCSSIAAPSPRGTDFPHAASDSETASCAGPSPRRPKELWNTVQLKSFRTVLRWQLAATVVMALVGGLLAGLHGAISVLLGGAVVSVAAGVSMIVASLGARTSASPGGALLAMLRAEAVKIAVIVLLMWLVLSSYKDVVILGFIGSFIVSVGILATAILANDSKVDERNRWPLKP